jgi:uncharacterized protein (TIGR03435 family)
MHRAILGAILIPCAAWRGFCQTPEASPRFEAADVHVSAKTQNAFFRSAPVRGGRMELKMATMVDLIRTAYGFNTDKILGGPNWLEMDRFDLIAKVPADATAETQKLMLQAELADRFKLVFHKDSKPLPTYALILGKKHKLKEAAGSERSGCRPQEASGAPPQGGVRLSTMGPEGTATTINLGPGMTVQYSCQNISMQAFAANLRGMIGTSLGATPVTDETGLQGNWSFDLKYSMRMFGPMMGANAEERITIFDALDKQLGLKLEEKPVPTPVLVVDSVNQTPSPNPPGVAEALPAIPVPTEFEVASLKPSAADMRSSRFQIQPGGRLLSTGMPLQFLISRAFNTFSNDHIVGLPAFASSDRYDIVAKIPAGGPSSMMDMEATASMMLSLLVDRFKLKYHTEEQPVAAYTLVAGKPKMKKADPASRAFCRNGNVEAGPSAGSRTLTCQNITMTQFAERLQGMTSDLSWPVLDATKLEGGWDFTLTFSMGGPMGGPMPMIAMAGGGGGGRGGEAAPGSAPLPAASDPTGGATLFEAVEKQLGLKLEKQKRSMPVIVIDHIEQKPTEN